MLKYKPTECADCPKIPQLVMYLDLLTHLWRGKMIVTAYNFEAGASKVRTVLPLAPTS